jgi:hypothetical protein
VLSCLRWCRRRIWLHQHNTQSQYLRAFITRLLHGPVIDGRARIKISPMMDHFIIASRDQSAWHQTRRNLYVYGMAFAHIFMLFYIFAMCVFFFVFYVSYVAAAAVVLRGWHISHIGRTCSLCRKITREYEAFLTLQIDPPPDTSLA